MGQTSSRKTKEEAQRRLAWAMPAYCVEKYVLTPDASRRIIGSWEAIMSGELPPFQAAVAKEPALLPVVLFYNNFYNFLFEIAPETKPLFKHGLEAQGRMLAAMIKYVVSACSPTTTGPLSSADLQLENSPSLDPLDTPADKSERILVNSLQHLARVHNALGIGADAYTVMGLVLIHAVRKSVGEAYWSPELHRAWIHVFSRMMKIMMPVIVAKELPRPVKLLPGMAAVCPATGAGGEAASCPAAAHTAAAAAAAAAPTVPAPTSAPHTPTTVVATAPHTPDALAAARGVSSVSVRTVPPLGGSASAARVTVEPYVRPKAPLGHASSFDDDDDGDVIFDYRGAAEAMRTHEAAFQRSQLQQHQQRSGSDGSLPLGAAYAHGESQRAVDGSALAVRSGRVHDLPLSSAPQFIIPEEPSGSSDQASLPGSDTMPTRRIEPAASMAH